MKTISQNNKVLNLLKRKRFVTHKDVFARYGITRTAARIRDLRDAGWEIETTGRDEHGFAIYYLNRL